MSSFRRYGGLNYSATNNITRSYISNSEQMNVNNYSGQQNSKEVFASHIDMSGNSILHTGCIYFQDGTVMCTASNAGAQGSQGPTGVQGSTGFGVTGPPGSGAQGATGVQGSTGFGVTGPPGFGAQGVTGATGAQGPTGFGVTGATGFGAQGATGVQGATGATGFGEQGATGAQGATGFGVTGPQGAAGSVNTAVPSVTFGIITSQTANIYIPISYPNQIYYGSLAAPVPVIAGNIFNVSNGSTIASILDTTAAGNTAFNPSYVKPLSLNSTYPGSGTYGNQLLGLGLGGIILSNQTLGTPAGTSVGVTFPDDSFRKSIYYNTTGLGTLGSTGTINGRYYDYANSSDPVAVSFSWYTSATPPTADAYYYSFSNTSYNTVAFTVTGPSKTNTKNDAGISVNSTAYYSTTGSTVRYNAAVSQNAFASVAFSPNTWVYPATPTTSSSITINTLYPNSYYTLNLTSTNSTGATSDYTWQTPGNPSSPAQPTFTTAFAPITYIPTSTNISGLSAVISTTPVSGTIYRVIDNAQIEYNLYNNQSIASTTLTNYGLMYGSSGGDYASPTTTNFYIGNNASSTTVLMTLNANIDGSTTANASSLTYKGFPTTAPSPSSSVSNFTTTTGTISDQYSVAGSTGFYLYQTGASFTLTANTLTAQSATHTFNLQQVYSAPSSTVTYSKNQSFYYDNLGATTFPSTPTIGAPTATSQSNYPVSGVNIIYTGTVTFPITTSVNNLADYFYVSNPLVYNFSNGVSGTVNQPDLTGGTQTGPNWTFSSKSITASVNTATTTTFTTSSTVTVQAFSVSTTGGVTSSSASYNLVIYDVPSYTLIFSMPAVVPTFSALGTAAGYRVWSAPDQTGANGANLSNTAYVVCPPAYGASTSTVSYSTIGYDQSWLLNSAGAATVSGVTIVTTQELQIYNGLYQSATVASSSGVLGYTDYTTYYNNSSINYSTNTNFGASAYRYATFCWKINSGVSASGLTFTIQNCNCTATALSSNTNTYAFKNSSTQQTQRYLMFYRTEQVESIPPTGNTSLSSVWIDANSTTYGTSISGTTPTYYTDGTTVVPMSTSNYYEPTGTTITNIRGSSAITVTNTTGNISILVPNIVATALSNPMYVYCRLGIPMFGFAVSFSGVTLALS
jgi:hypothetical protein